MEKTTPSVLTSDELNLLIFRYLQESGFKHAAFAFEKEAGACKSSVDENLIPPGHLVTLIQKGLQYKEIQANLDSAKNSCADDYFSLLQPLDIITKDVDVLQRIIKHSKKVSADEKDRGRLESDKEQDRGKEKVEEDKELVREHKKNKESAEDNDKANNEAPKGEMKMKTKQHGVCAGKPMDITTNAQSVPCEIPSSDVVIGHSSPVSCYAWSPTNSLLASGSEDSTAQIWTIPDGPCGSSMQNLALCPKVLTRFEGSPETTKDVTALAWNGPGSLLATGYYDGQTRIWSKDGELKNILIKHEGLIFSLKWNKRGSHLLTGSYDKSAILWDTRTWECKQHFHCHHAPTLDVDWRNNNSFATCSVDCKICVFKIGNYLPCKVFEGHQVLEARCKIWGDVVSSPSSKLQSMDSVNCIKWDPNGSFLASCSDDKTAKIWTLKQDKCLHDFREHQGAVSTIRWSPTGPGTNNPNQQILLASASSDSFVKLWDAEMGRLVCNLKGHREEPVCSVEFSPNGQFLASGSSSDKCVNIWSVNEGQLVKTYRGRGEILQVCWNKEGNKIVACSSNGTVCVMDCRM